MSQVERELRVGHDVGDPIALEARSAGQIELPVELMEIDLDSARQPGLPTNRRDVHSATSLESLPDSGVHCRTNPDAVRDVPGQ